MVREGSAGEFLKDKFGVVASEISQTSESSISVTFFPGALPQADERLVFLTDFRLELNSFVTLSSVVVNNKRYRKVSVLSLRHKVGGLEGRSRLELLLLLPEGAAEAAAVWPDCLWELHLVEVEATKENEENNDLKSSDDAEEKATVLTRWVDSASFDASRWHSVALTLQASPDPALQAGGRGGAELTVDGAGRMKVDGSFEEGVAAAWLPLSNAGELDEASESRVSMVFRVGQGGNFGGFVKSLVLISGHEGSKVQDMTTSFCENFSESNEVPISEAVGEEEDDNENSSVEKEVTVPPDCVEVEEVVIISCGGRGCADGLLVPVTTPAGIYVLEVFDNVDEQCLYRVDQAPESASSLPFDVAPLCRLVPYIGSSLLKYKIAVE